jgi:hypothetical protein
MSPRLPFARPVQQDVGERPRLFVVVDTEEEFDWNAPPSRTETNVTAMKHVDRVQKIFDRFQLKPTYVIDYPVASQPAGYEPLLPIHADGRCAIGAHLHPWVNPPYTEEVSPRNTFLMNLPTALQDQKLKALTETIAAVAGKAPIVFKAGRYGLGGDTARLLEQQGYLVDSSVCPRMDFSPIDGPSFADFDSSPFMMSDVMLEVPCTVDYVGWAGALGRPLHNAASHPSLRALRGIGILSKLGAVNRVMLSPEGNTLTEMMALARTLIDRGARVLTLSFHSPSVAAGHTPYVRTQRDLDEFLERIERFCDYFFGRLNGQPDTMLGFYDRALSHTGPTA